MWKGSWVHLSTFTSSFCSMSKLVGWFMLKKVTKYTALLNLCIFQTHIQKR